MTVSAGGNISQADGYTTLTQAASAGDRASKQTGRKHRHPLGPPLI